MAVKYVDSRTTTPGLGSAARAQQAKPRWLVKASTRETTSELRGPAGHHGRVRRPVSGAVPGRRGWAVTHRFEVSLTWEVEENVFMPIRVMGIKRPAIPAVRAGHPDNWEPAEGGELEDIKVYSGGRLTPKLEYKLITDPAFHRAIEAAL